jgi:hypothetical protein
LQARTSVLAVVPLALLLLPAAWTSAQTPLSTTGSHAAADVVVHVADLPASALSEFDFWNGPASPGGKMIGTPNSGGDLDPPPENDPHVTMNVQVQPATQYRCWIHMYVGKPKGVSKANLVWVQFTGAVDKSNKEVLKPGTGDYLTVKGPEKEGWVWVGSDRLVSFRVGDVTVRVQAGMEGVGFDQLVLSPSKFLEHAPSENVVPKTR